MKLSFLNITELKSICRSDRYYTRKDGVLVYIITYSYMSDSKKRTWLMIVYSEFNKGNWELKQSEGDFNEVFLEGKASPQYSYNNRCQYELSEAKYVQATVEENGIRFTKNLEKF